MDLQIQTRLPAQAAGYRVPLQAWLAAVGYWRERPELWFHQRRRREPRLRRCQRPELQVHPAPLPVLPARRRLATKKETSNRDAIAETRARR